MVDLHLATVFGLSELVESVLRNLDINARDSRGRTALVWVLECLAFEFEFKPNYRGSRIQNFETYDAIDAIETAHRRVIKALLRLGANPHITGYNGDTPLHLAAILGDVEIVQSLLDYGADVDSHISNRYGYIPLALAVRYGKESTYMRLLERGAVDVCGENSRTALIEAACVGDLALIEELIKKGANVGFPDVNGQTALMEASGRGYIQIVELLLRNQSYLDHQDHKGDTALLKACIGDHADIIELLIVANARPDIENNEGDTALDYCTKYCREDSIKRLLHSITDPTLRDKHSRTFLISANRWKRSDIVSLILEDAELKPTSKFITLPLSEWCSPLWES
ncbi:uncharacterized protein FPRN_03874 [Fusarium proliferatum]|nr:uncharacterized protein FPRN_03874 [Fusarium proliferatum]